MNILYDNLPIKDIYLENVGFMAYQLINNLEAT